MITTTLRTRVLVLLAGLVVAAGAVARADRREAAPARTSFAAFPMEISSWRGVPQPPLTPAVLKVLGATDYLTRAYVTPERESVGLYIGYWDSQRQGDTIHSPLNCLPGAGWEPVSGSRPTLPDPRRSSTGEIRVNRYVIQKGIDRQLVLYWYQSHGRVVASEYWGRFYLVADAVRLNRTDGAIVRITTRIVGDTPEAEAAAERIALGFLGVLMPTLDPFLPV